MCVLQSLADISIARAILGEAVLKEWKSIILFGLIQGGLFEFLCPRLSPYPIICVFFWLVVDLLLIKLLFKGSWWSALLLDIVFLFMDIVIESFGFAISMYGFNVSYRSIAAYGADSRLGFISAYVLITLIAFVLYKSGVFSYTSRIQEYWFMPHVGRILFLFLAEVFLLLILLNKLSSYSKLLANSHGITIIIAIIVLSFIAIFATMAWIAQNAARSLEKRILDDIRDSIYQISTTLKTQRHDIVSHLQVLSVLHEQGKYQEAGIYINDLCSDTANLNQVLIFDNPYLSALLNTKISQAEAKGIRFDLDAINIPAVDYAVDLIRIIGNLIDNAIEAVDKFEVHEQRWVRVSFSKKAPFYVISVTNPVSGNIENTQEWFKAGYTSKAEGNRGYGLYICRQVCHKHGGNIYCNSDKEKREIMFSVIMPITNNADILYRSISSGEKAY